MEQIGQAIVMNFTDNETTIASPHALDPVTKGLYTFVIPIICFFGIVGNILSFKVFMFTSFGNHSSSTYIGALSMSDTAFLVSLMLSWVGGGRFVGVEYGSSAIWCHIMIYITYVCSFLSVWYVVLIMIDRYIVVCHSLRVPEWCTRRRSRMATSIVTAFAFVFYSYTFYTADGFGQNCGIKFKPFMLKILSYFIYTDTAITFIIPFGIIFFLNTIVILSLKRFQLRHVTIRQRKSGTTPQINVLSEAQFRITRTFVLVSIVMLVTNVPSHGMRFYFIVNQLIEINSSSLVSAQHVFLIIYYSNFAVNFLIYSVSSKKFRIYLTCKYLCNYWYRRNQHRRNNHLYQ